MFNVIMKRCARKVRTCSTCERDLYHRTRVVGDAGGDDRARAAASSVGLARTLADADAAVVDTADDDDEACDGTWWNDRNV
jgi:hypothetical protein